MKKVKIFRNMYEFGNKVLIEQKIRENEVKNLQNFKFLKYY